MSGAYYNEIDPRAAAWLKELIKRGHIADGEVDTRSITDVRPQDLRGFTQCHFFAGIGVWSAALRDAGWDDSRPVWTGSCPCQPFSNAGKGAGFADERHLWPGWHWLIKQCRPPIIFGEQSASKRSLAWLDLVFSDLEGENYSPEAVDICAAGVGAPHLRQRMYFVAHTNCKRHAGQRILLRTKDGGWEPQEAIPEAPRRAAPGELGNPGRPGTRRDAGTVLGTKKKSCGEGIKTGDQPNGTISTGPACLVLGNTNRKGLARRSRQPEDNGPRQPATERAGRELGGFWSNGEWVYCEDNRYRAIEPGTFPLAYGAPARVGRLRGYGNAIVKQAATEFIKAYLNTELEITK